MKFKKLLGALAISLVPAAAAAQSGKLTTNYSDGQKYVCASYWNPNPRIRLCYEGDDKFTFGTFIPLSKSKLKIAAGNTGDIEEQGIYFTQEKGPLLMGTGAEHLNGGLSAEVHAKINISKNHAAFAGYGNTNGISTVTVGGMSDVGRNHVAAGLAKRTDNLGKELKIPFSEKNQVLLYYSRDGLAKFFYANDGNLQSLFGFVRLGGRYLPYTRGAFDADRFDFLQQPIVHSRYWTYHPILPPQNTHLSEQGACAFSPRFSRNEETRTAMYSAEGFCMHDSFIGGYGFEHSRKADKEITSHKISGGKVIGPVRLVGSWDTKRGFSVYGSVTK